jgi:hypothetical protein
MEAVEDKRRALVWEIKRKLAEDRVANHLLHAALYLQAADLGHCQHRLVINSLAVASGPASNGNWKINLKGLKLRTCREGNPLTGAAMAGAD